MFFANECLLICVQASPLLTADLVTWTLSGLRAVDALEWALHGLRKNHPVFFLVHLCSTWYVYLSWGVGTST